jgi:ATP-binding cassette subfamily C protein LapB
VLRITQPEESSVAAEGGLSPVHGLRARLFAALPGFASTSLGIPLVVALRHAMSSGAATALESDESLLARFGEQPALENLIQFASAQGMTLTPRRSVKSMDKVALPAVVVLRDGSAIAVVAQQPSGRLHCQTARGGEVLARGRVERLSSGHVIELRRSNPVDSSVRYAAFANLLRLASLVASADRRHLLQVLVTALLSNLLLVVLPLFITVVYDRVVPYGAFETLTALSLGVGVVLAIDIGLRMARVNLQEALGVGVSLSLQALFYRKIVRAPLTANRNAASGLTALLHETDGAAMAMPSLMVGLAADLPFVIVMLLLVQHLGGAVAMVPLFGVVLVALITAIGSQRAHKAAGVAHRLKVKVQDQVVETAASLETVKASRAEAQLMSRWAQATDAFTYAAHSSRQTSAWASQISLVTTQLVIALTVVVGAVQISAGVITLGNLAACVLLVGRIIAPANTIVANIGALANMRNAIGGFFSVIDREEEVGGDQMALGSRPLAGRIDFHNVRFTYPGAARPSIDGVSFAIIPGERVGIIGRNGCGKSTLLKMMLRLYDAESGSVLFDGANAMQLPPQHLRRSISLMTQDTVLLNDTLRANITLGFDAVDPNDFERAVQLSGVAEFARRHAQGYGAPVGPRGERLSGGERQAVGLARVILNDPRVLLLDEPTAAMDNTAENMLIQQLPAFLTGRTVILATHRLQLLNLVDRVIWMDNGRVVADGPRAQVLASLTKAA